MAQTRSGPPHGNINQLVKIRIERVSDFLSKRGTAFITALGLVILIITGIANTFVHQKLSLSVFYLVPVCLVTWYTTRYLGILFAFLGGVSLTLSHYETIVTYRQWIAHIWNSLGTVFFFCLMVLLLRLLKSRLEHEKGLAQLDPLTGAANRRSFYTTLSNEIERSKRYKHAFTVVFIDLDNFKEVNDKHGHQTGDQLLRLTTEKLKQNIRTCDFMARFGGDEFSILFPETNKERISVLISRIRFAILDTMKENDWPVTLSIGVATFQNPPDTVDEALGDVDRLMYSAKRKGKDMIEYGVY
ncbi:MAG: GGDEF domain-containing protein [Deltaproteobacteria bacterium]|nr:GGDEF domain-containing protein [Deltaproteobacteria bacterium]